MAAQPTAVMMVVRLVYQAAPNSSSSSGWKLSPVGAEGWEASGLFGSQPAGQAACRLTQPAGRADREACGGACARAVQPPAPASNKTCTGCRQDAASSRPPTCDDQVGYTAAKGVGDQHDAHQQRQLRPQHLADLGEGRRGQGSWCMERTLGRSRPDVTACRHIVWFRCKASQPARRAAATAGQGTTGQPPWRKPSAPGRCRWRSWCTLRTDCSSESEM